MREAVNDRAILSKSLTKEERGMYFICLLLKADLYTSDALMTCLVLLRYFMYFMALTNHQSVIGQIKSVFVRYEVYVLVFCHMVFWSTVIWMAMAFRWYHRHPEALNFSGDSDKGMVGIMNRVKWIQNGVMQVIFFGTLQWIMVNYTQIWQSVLLAVLLMLEVVLVKMSLYFLTDTIPRDKLFAVMNKGQEILLATINKIILAIGLLSDLNLFSFVRIYLQAALCLTLGALWVFYCLKVKYWSEKANFLVMGLQLFLFVCSLVSFAETIGVHESNALLVASVCYPISLKAGINKIKSLKLSRTFDIKNKTIVNPYASASMDKVLRKADKLGQKNTEYFLYYQGLILEMLKVPKEVCLIKTAEVETVEDLDRVIVQNALKNKLELDSLKLAFFFFLKFPYHNFAFCTIFLGRMKCLMDSRYSDKLQWFYFKLLLESKFEGFYFFKEVDSSKSKDLCGLYRDIAITSNKPPSQEYVNINYPLQCKQVYLVLLEKLKNTTGRLKDQFNYLISCRSISKPVSIHKLYHYNLKLASANAKLKASLSFMREYIPEPPQYYYPALYSYYAGILFDPVKAGEILKLFKSGKETWSLIKSKSKNIRPDSASEDTVVLQMSTAKQNAGEITDATPNAERILKVRPGDKEVIGRNCNELFVDFLQAKHKVFMTGMTAVDKIVNVKGEFFLKLFDKSLNEVDFVIKFAFHIQKYPSMVISLRALNKLHNQFFVITNLTFEIIQAEKGFWRAIGKRKHIDKFNINAICQRINKMGKIVKIVMELDKFKDSKSSSASLSPTFKAMLKNILDSNKNDSLCFIADHGSEMHQKSGISKMIVRFEPGNFGKTFFYKLYITFQGARIAALETVANRSIKNTTFQTFEKSMLDRNNSSEGSFQENEEFYGKYNSKNGETLAFLNTIMADDIIRQLAGILADNNPGSVDLIVGDLKKKLSDLIKEVGLYQKIAAKDLEARTNNLSHLKSASAFPKIVEALEMENNEKSERDDFNNQKELKITNKVKTPQVIKQKLLNQKTTNEHELSASIQKKASTQTNNKLLTTDSIRSDDNRMNLQSLIKSTYGKDNLKDVCRSKSTEKAKLSKPQTILNQAIVENKSYQYEEILEEMESNKSFRGGQINRSFKTDKKRNLGDILLLKIDLVEVKKEKIRKAKLVQMSKTNRKPGWYWFIYLSIFAVYLSVVLAALFISQSIISSHSNSTNELFKITMIYNDCNFHISNSATSFLDYKSVAYSRATLTAADHAMINRSFFTDDFDAFKLTSMAGDYSELGQKITEINDRLVNSQQLVDIGYARDEFERSYSLRYNITENTMSPNDTDRKSYIDLDLITLQSIRKYRSALNDELGISSLDYEPIINERRRFIIDKGLGDIVGKVHMQVSNSRTRFENLSSNYRKNFAVTIWTTTGAVAVIFIIWLAVLYFHRKTVADILQTYCVLSFQTLEVELERVHSIENAVYLNIFSALDNMKQARSGLNELMLEQNDAWNDGRGMQYADTLSFEAKMKRSLKSIVNKSRVGRNSFSQLSKFIYGTPVKVFWYAFFMILLLILIWGIEAILINTIGQIVKDSNTIKEMAMENIEYCMKLRVDFSRYFRLSPYVVAHLDKNQIANAYKELSYAGDHEKYLIWWTKNRGILIETFGRASTFAILQNADLCSLELRAEYADDHAFQDVWPDNVKLACQTGLNGVLKKGYFQYSIFEANMMKSVKQKLEPIIKDIYSLTTSDLLARLQAVWFAQDFAQLRAWHQLVYSNLLAVTTTEFEGDIEKKTAAAELYIQSLERVGIVLAILPLLFYVLVVIPLIIKTHDTSLLTFDTISPLAIVSSQLSMKKYKTYYGMTSK